MITKEFTIFYYEQFLYLKNYSPLSTSLFFKKLLGSLSLSLSLQFLRSSLYYLFQIFFFFEREKILFPLLFRISSQFLIYSPSLSLSLPFRNPKQVSIFLSQGSQDSLHFLIFLEEEERGASWTLRDPFALISLKFSKWTTSREKKASKRGRGRGRDSSPPRR